MEPLGKLKRCSVRDVWKHEAADFTPWLRENIRLLSDLLGLELDLVEREAPVGDFSCDLVARDLNSGRWVVIENQLGSTDHSHLGQVLTYGANRKADVVVWISPSFRDEHREALEWLNRSTGDNLDFFGVQVEVVQIDDSPMAPSFSLAVKPGFRSPTPPETTAKQQAYNEFFAALLAKLKKASPGITSAQRVGYGSWFAFSAGKSGYQYSFSFTQDRRFRVELYIDTGDAQENSAAFQALRADSEAIEAQVGAAPTWEELEGKRACRLAIYAGDHQVTDPPDTLEQLQDWSIKTVLALRTAITPRLQSRSPVGS